MSLCHFESCEGHRGPRILVGLTIVRTFWVPKCEALIPLDRLVAQTQSRERFKIRGFHCDILSEHRLINGMIATEGVELLDPSQRDQSQKHTSVHRTYRPGIKKAGSLS